MTRPTADEVSPEHEQLVAAAVHDGRMPPSHRDYWLTQLKADADGSTEVRPPPPPLSRRSSTRGEAPAPGHAAAALAALPMNTLPLQRIGYGSKRENFDDREWEWLDSHEPDLQLRCESSRQVVGHAWRAPDGETWYRSGRFQGPLADRLTDVGNVPVECPAHGMALLPAAYVLDEAASTRRNANVLCLDPVPVYRRR